MTKMDYNRPSLVKKDRWNTHDQFLSFKAYESRFVSERVNAMDNRVALYEGVNEELLEYSRRCLFGGSLTDRERGRASYLLSCER